MRSTRITITSLAIAALATCGVGSTAADAGSLLSGYGGPGQGNQAILGSALINGPSGKGGTGAGRSGGGAGGSTQTPGDGSLVAAPASAAGRSAEASVSGATGKASIAAAGARRPARASTGGGSVERASAGGHRAYERPSEPAGAGSGSQPLGLSGADLGYVVLALVLLAFTGVLTRRLARQPVSG